MSRGRWRRWSRPVLRFAARARDSVATFLRQLLDTAAARVSRSTAIQPWHWTIAIMVALMVAALATGKAPGWLLVWAACLVTLALVCGGVAYFYLLVKDRDALRSEKFTLDKLRIERGMVGDSARGLQQATEPPRLIETKVITSGEEL